MCEIDKAYFQVSTPNAGTTGTAASKDDALGNPSRFKRNQPSVAVPDSKQELVELREKQLDTDKTDQIAGNMYQGN